MSPTISCPENKQLVELSLGTVPRQELERLTLHLEHCSACQDLLQSLAPAADSLVLGLRRAKDSSISTRDPVPAKLLEAVQGPAFLHSLPGPQPGAKYGKFELLEELGRGSFGRVFRAWDPELERLVALKISRTTVWAETDDMERVLREARSVARLHHPGIVALHEIGQAPDGACFLVEEFIHGQTLACMLHSRARPGAAGLPFLESAQLLIQVAQALHYAHQHGIIHRDLKPDNIILDEQGLPHVMDFGLAKRETDERPLTLEGEVLGTPAYMSPEQARGESQKVDARSDVYSLGVILYELLTGERPFRGNRRMLLLQVLLDDPRPPRQLNDKVPRDLETICLKALARSPARRYQSAAELAAELQRWLAAEPIRARPVSALERLGRWCRRNPLAASLFLAVTLGSTFGMIHLSRLSTDLVRSAALESAAQHSELLDMVNRRYSSEVVDRAQQQGLQARADYRGHLGAIPLPATFTIDLGEHLADQNASGVQVRLYSDFPFRTRTDGGPRDDFEKEALRQLRTDPDHPYYRFEYTQPRPVLRYATARRMEATCVACHNHHPDSSRTTWKVGDVRGVLEIIRPLDRDIERTRKGLRGTFFLITGIAALLLGVTVAAVMIANRRSSLRVTHARSDSSPGEQAN